MKRVAIRQFAPAAALALLFTLGVTAASAHDGGRHGKMGGGFGMRALSHLDLTESQRAEVRRIMESKKATFETLRERIRADKEALDSIADGPSPNAAAVGNAYLKVRATREAMRAEHEAMRDQIRSILTPEQQQKLDTMKEEHKERFGERRGKRGTSSF